MCNGSSDPPEWFSCGDADDATETSQDKTDCKNDDSWEYITRKGKSKSCRWVENKPKKRCSGKRGKDGRDLSQACPKECNPACAK